MAKSSQVTRIEFLRSLWSCSQGSIVDLRAIPVGGGGRPIQEFVRTPTEINDFAEQFGHRGSNYSTFFGVCKREAQSGKKDAIKRIPALWADIDTVANGYAPEVAMKLVAQLPPTMLPSAVINSGGGLHLYWLLREPLTSHKQAEDANVLIRDLVGGDNVQDVSRVMRLPETWNNKRKPARKCEVVYLQDHRRFDVDDLVDLVLTYPRVIDGQKWVSRPAKEARAEKVPGTEAIRNALASTTKVALNNLNAFWRDRVREHAPRGYYGVHHASLLTTARLYAMGGYTDDYIVATTLRYMRDVPGFDHADRDWNLEAQKVSKALDSWKPKWQQIKEAEKAAKKAARSNANSTKV